MRRVAGGKFVCERLTRLDDEKLVGVPLAVGVEVHLDGEFDGLFGVVRKGEGFLVVAGDEIGVAGLFGFHGGVFPRAADAVGFAELPQVINGTEPEFGIGVAEDVAVVGRGGFHAAHHQHAAPDAEVGDGLVVCGDRLHALEVRQVSHACGRVGSARDLVEGAVVVGEVSLLDALAHAA